MPLPAGGKEKRQSQGSILCLKLKVFYGNDKEYIFVDVPLLVHHCKGIQLVSMKIKPLNPSFPPFSSTLIILKALIKRLRQRNNYFSLSSFFLFFPLSLSFLNPLLPASRAREDTPRRYSPYPINTRPVL
jgi:hypothetical protein